MYQQTANITPDKRAYPHSYFSRKANVVVFIRSALAFFVVAALNSFPAIGNICCLLITFANSLDRYQARQNVGPDLDPNCLTLMVFL